MIGSDILHRVLNTVIFQERRYIDELFSFINSTTADEFEKLIKNDPADSYRYYWEYLDKIATYIHSLNNENIFCAYGRARNKSQISFFSQALKRFWKPGCVTLDLGCGQQAPLSSSLIMRMNGASKAYAVDVFPDLSPEQTLEALRKIFLDAIVSPQTYNFSKVSREEFLAQVIKIDFTDTDAKSLVQKAEENNIFYNIIDFSSYDILPNFDFIHSVSVIEHIPDLNVCFKTLRSHMPSGAGMCHVVDFSDHAFIINKAPHRWHHLTTEGQLWGVNGFRLSEVVASIESAGFRVEIDSKMHEEPPASVRENLSDRFKGISDDDLKCHQATIIATAL